VPRILLAEDLPEALPDDVTVLAISLEGP